MYALKFNVHKYNRTGWSRFGAVTPLLLFIALAEADTWQDPEVCQAKMCRTAWPAVSKCIKTNYKY